MGKAPLRVKAPPGQVLLQRIPNGGKHWTSPRSTALPNPNAAVSALRLADGNILIAYNDSARTRDNMALSVSADGGENWHTPCVLERFGADSTARQTRELSYPYMIQTAEGEIHLVYTWHRSRLKHIWFDRLGLDHPPFSGRAQSATAQRQESSVTHHDGCGRSPHPPGCHHEALFGAALQVRRNP